MKEFIEKENQSVIIKPRGEEFKLNESGIHKYRLLKESTDPALNDEFQYASKSETLSEQFDVVDLHSHTNLTDGVISPEELVENAVMNGITILAVTDHNCTKSAIAAKQYAEEKYPGQIKIILGVELATESGHLLVYFRDEEAMRRAEEEFPFIKYVNEHTDEMQRDYRKYYRDFMENAPYADNLEVTLNKLKTIQGIKTSMAHPFAGTKLLAEIAKKRGLTALGGAMIHPDWNEELTGQIDMFEVQNDFSPVGNSKARKFFSENKMQNLSTGSDSRIADPQTLTLIEKEKDLFNEIETGRTIFIQREKDKLDKYFDRVVQWQAWLGDYYMSEVKRETKEVLSPNIILDAIQGAQVKIRKCLYGKAYQKWKETRR